MENKVLYIVVPCFNEEEILNQSSEILKTKLKDLIKKNMVSKKSKILFVDDGSLDNTWNIIVSLFEKDKIFYGVKLSKNKGHQNALLAGLEIAKKNSDMAISIDADLQDDVDAIEKMVEKFNQGFDIVFGVRSSRKKDTFFKKFTAETFYKLMNLLGAKTVFNHADFRLMSKKALLALEKFKENNIFLRGIVPTLGFKNCCVFYSRKERTAGETKYPLKKMISFAINGIISCSVKLLHIIFFTGIIFLLAGFITTIYFLFALFKNNFNTEFIAVLASVWSVGGIVLISLGIVGEYVGKIYIETKKRPRYIIEKILSEDSSKDLEKK